MAHDEASVPVEAAASLFGAGDETTTDFFATNFGDVSLVEDQNSPEQRPSLQDSSAAATLFEAGPDETASLLFGPTTSHDSLQPGGHVDNPHEHTDATFQGPSNMDYDMGGYQRQGWQDEQGQWHDYDYQNGDTSTYDYASQQHQPPTDAYASQVNSSSQLYDYSQHSTDHVPPFSPPAPIPASQPDYSQRYAPQQPSQPLLGHQSTYANSYATSQGTSSPHVAYNAYSPAVHSSSTANSAPYEVQPIPPRITSGNKDVNAYRPTTLNAYDPPVSMKTRSKARSAFSNSSLPYSHFNGSQSQHASIPPPPLPPPPPQAHKAVTDPDFSSSSPTTAEQSYNIKGISHSPVEEFQREPPSAPNVELHRDPYETYPSLDLEPTGPLGVLGTQPSSTKGELSHGDPGAQGRPPIHGHSAEERGSSSYGDAISSYHPEKDAFTSLDAAAAVPVNSSAYTSPPEQHYVYGLDDQPFGNGQNSSDTLMNSMTPPPQTGSPVEIDTRAPGVPPYNGPPGSHHTDDPYHPTNHSRENSDELHTAPTLSQSEPASTIPWNRYAPSTAPEPPRRGSGASASYDTYDIHGSQSVSSNAPPDTSHDPYAPSSRLHRVQSRHSDLSYTGEYTSRYDYPDMTGSGQLQGELEVTSVPDATAGLANVLTAPTYAPYAPSPSLLGTNDPLGRAAARVPVISFGFGGKLVSCFHSAGETASGFDVSLSARQSTDVQLRTLHEVIPASAMDSSASSYPGPLFSDPGTSSISLARTVGVGTASNVKSKKMLVSKWLEERANEISSGVAYISSGTQERHNSEGRLVLVRLLKAMLDNDGQLSGSPSIEWAVRSALIPRLESERPPIDGLSSTDKPTYTSSLADINEVPLTVYHLRASALDRIQEFLLRGERRQAYHYALDEKLWAHAMLIASSIDNLAWKEVVKEFLHSELAVRQPPGPLPGSKSSSGGPLTNGRESLRVAYSLFAGHGAAAVQELIPPRALPTHKDSFLIPQIGLHNTPVSPNFPQPALTSSVPAETLSKWHETAAVMAFSQTTGDSAALTALGDYLAANRWFEAAHACYLLSPRTSSLGGAGVPSVRLVLVGSESPSSLHNFSKDLDITIFSEIVEFALSLSPAKGQETFGGLPHLQAYKLIRAAHLAEMGHVEVANRYCEAIGSVIRASARGSPFYTPTFIGELKNLSDRLTAAPQLDKTASWISSKLAKPSLDTIGSWLEGRFSKLIVGEGEGEAGQEPDVSEQVQPPKSNYGPFSHYSTISSVTTSASPSPSPTPYGPNGTDTTSTTTSVPFGVYNSHVQIDRASSAMDHLRPQVRRTSPVQRVASASAATTTFAQASNPSARYRQDHGTVNDLPESETDSQEVTWWGSSMQDGNGPTPTAATFYKVDEGQSDGNFVSLMDSYSPAVTSTTPQSQPQSKTEAEEDEEDLGFGNTTRRTPKPGGATSSETKVTEKPQPGPKGTPDRPELTQKSSSWFGRWWGRSSESTTSGPIKAKLGEETSFYYDKELKRWVNKKVGGAEATVSTPTPPPPSRPRTASPAPGGPPVAKPTNGPSIGPPPTRPASAAEMSMPPRKPPRVRSNLVPTEESPTPGSAPPSATSFETAKAGPGLAPPSGIGRPKSSASKRNVRSRYVDVLQ